MTYVPLALPGEIRDSAHRIHSGANQFDDELLAQLRQTIGSQLRKIPGLYRTAEKTLGARREALDTPGLRQYDRDLQGRGRNLTRKTLKEINQAGSQHRIGLAEDQARNNYDNAYQSSLARQQQARSRAGLLPSGIDTSQSAGEAAGLATALNAARTQERYQGEAVRRGFLPQSMALSEQQASRLGQLSDIDQNIAGLRVGAGEAVNSLTSGFAANQARGNEFHGDSIGAQKTILDYENARNRAKQQKKGGLWKTVGTIGGTALGFAIGGPAGAQLGASIGGGIGGGLGGGDWNGAANDVAGGFGEYFGGGGTFGSGGGDGGYLNTTGGRPLSSEQVDYTYGGGSPSQNFRQASWRV